MAFLYKGPICLKLTFLFQSGLRKVIWIIFYEYSHAKFADKNRHIQSEFKTDSNY